MRTDGSSPPTLEAECARCRRSDAIAGGSPSRQAPDAGGLPTTERVLASVMKAEGTVSSGVCQSMSLQVSRTIRGGVVCYATPPRRGRLPRAGGALAAAVTLRAASNPRCRSALRSSTFSMSDRQTHEPRRDTGRQLLLGGELRVGRRCRVDDEAAHVADVGEVAEQLRRSRPAARPASTPPLSSNETTAPTPLGAYLLAAAYHGLDGSPA